MGNTRSRSSRDARYYNDNRRSSSTSRFEKSLRNRPHSRDDRLVMAWDRYIRNFSKIESEKYPYGAYISQQEIDEFLYALQATPNFYPKSNYMLLIPIIVGFVLIAIIAGIGGRSSGSRSWIAIVAVIIFISMIAGAFYFNRQHTLGLEQRQREF